MAEDTGLIIEGKPTDYLFFPGEATVVSHAEFLFRNETSEVKSARIISTYFIESETPVPLPQFYVYARNNKPLGPTVKVASMSVEEIRITFPARQVNVGIRYKYQVQLTVECEGNQFSATSTLNLTQEKAQQE